jgi:hypothetical protein
VAALYAQKSTGRLCKRAATFNMISLLILTKEFIMFHLNGILRRIVYAILVAVIVYIVVLIIAYVLGLIPMLAGIGGILTRFAYVLALLAGIVTFLTGWTPTRQGPAA